MGKKSVTKGGRARSTAGQNPSLTCCQTEVWRHPGAVHRRSACVRGHSAALGCRPDGDRGVPGRQSGGGRVRRCSRRSPTSGATCEACRGRSPLGGPRCWNHGRLGRPRRFHRPTRPAPRASPRAVLVAQLTRSLGTSTGRITTRQEFHINGSEILLGCSRPPPGRRACSAAGLAPATGTEAERLRSQAFHSRVFQG